MTLPANVLREELAPTQLGGPDANGAAPAAVRFLGLTEYVARPKGSPDALLGTPDENLVTAGGMLQLYGGQGAGKTTLAVHLVAHLASGSDWLGKAVGRPVRVALIENEGPAEPWRRKLAAAVETWTGDPWADNVLVLDEPHGGFDFRRAEHREAVRELRADGVEVVVADPTKWLGFRGGGTPDEVTEFVALLRDCGLHGAGSSALAFVLLHHENKAGEVSGAWGADPDTQVHVEGDGRERTKLTWEKCRWASAQHGVVEVLQWLPESAGFVLLDLPDGPRVSDEELEEAVLAWLTEHPERHATSHVRKAVTGQNERIDAALERLRERGEVLDYGPNGAPYTGRPGEPHYWEARAHAASEVAPTLWATPGDPPPDSPGRVGGRPVAPSIRGATLGRGDPPGEGEL